MSRFSISGLENLKPYAPGEQPADRRYIKLNTNESPYPPSPRVVNALGAERISSLQLYPDPMSGELSKALANYYDVEADRVMVGNGSDEILAFFFMAFCAGGNPLCFPDISYGFYGVYASLFGADALEIPLKDDLSLEAEDYLARGRNIIIANPNAPTGLCISVRDIEKILKTNPRHLVLIDEAYIDFGGESCRVLLPHYDNLAICGTFSKSRSLAGARLGFCLASPEVIADMNKIRYSFNPYNVNRLTQIAGIAALEDQDYFEHCRTQVITTRGRAACELRALGFQITDSKANFIFARHADISGEDWYLLLKDRGILVRHFGGDRIRDYVRITVGTSEQMRELLRAITDILEEV